MKELVCKICDKKYKTIQSLCNHNKRFHNTIIPICVTTPSVNVTTPNANVTTYSSEINKLVQDEHLITTSQGYTKYQCKHCNKGFKLRQNKWTHENKYCKIKKTINSCTEKQQAEINENIKIPTIINNINNTNNGTINNNITINNYSNDNIEYISDAFIKRMFNHLKYEKNHIIPIPTMIENIKFNPNHKENNNVKITNMRSKVAMIYDNNKWSTVGKKELLDELYIFATNLFKNWSEMKDFITEEMKINYKKFSKHSQIVLTKSFMEEINRKAYIYTKNNDTTLD